MKLRHDRPCFRGTDMAALISEMDWSQTALGPIQQWPQSLRTSVSICLSSRFPIVLWWGPDFIMLYNDAYLPILGDKHPRSLGQPGEFFWSEIWDVIGPMLARVREKGEATWSEDLMLAIDRSGYAEEGYFTFSYSPIHGETGSVDGIFCAVAETTRKQLSERRLNVLRELGERSAQRATVEETCRQAIAVIGENRLDIPCAAVYLCSENPDENDFIRLIGAVGVAEGSAFAPLTLAVADASVWPAGQALATGQPVAVDRIVERFGAIPSVAWPESVSQAVVLPLARRGEQDGCPGLLMAGVSPRRALDGDYMTFLELLAGHIGTSIMTARAYERQQATVQALAELDRVKTDFFSNVSHELRTPITLMLGPLEDLLSSGEAEHDAELSPAQTETLKLVHRNGLRLLKLINTLLDFSRLEAGRASAVFEPTDLAEHTAELASLFQSAAQRAGLEFTINIEPQQQLVYVDREMWEKVVLNLLSNAFKYTIKGQIRVEIKESADDFHLVVEDTGCGIPEAEIPKLFERFYRVPEAVGRSREGTGIGLALVNELVKLHGGNVQVTSKLNAGTCVTVSIPLGSGHLPPEQLCGERAAESTAIVPAAFLAETELWTRDGAGLQSPAQSDATPPTKRRIVLADDNADMRDYVGSLLAQEYDVATASDGVEALKLIQDHVPDLVLSDIMMPNMDGLELVKALRVDAATKAVPIILLSARAGEEAELHGLGTGADDYLIKPFSARELRARVATHIKMTDIRREAELRQRGIAETLQRALLQFPSEDAFPGFVIAARYEAAAAEFQVGGDFSDAFMLPTGQLALFVGDVTGKGLQAATYTAEIKFTLRAYLTEDASPASALTRLNRYVQSCVRWDGRAYETLGALAIVVIDADTGSASVSLAGAEPPLLLSLSGGASPVEAYGPTLGASLDSVYRNSGLTLEPGESLVFTTDGITEARQGRNFFGYDGFQRIAQSAAEAGSSPAQIVSAILNAAQEFANGHFADDVCLLAVQRHV